MSLRLAVLLSGSGRSLQNLIDRTVDGRLAAHIVRVIASRPDAGGLRRAEAAGIASGVVTRQEFPDVASRGETIFAACRAANVDLVCLAGYLHLLQIPDDFAGRVMNIHPSLLPAFGGHGMYGDRVHAAALAAGVKLSGCTVHLADNQYDTGPIILQRAVPVEDDDTPSTLAARVFAAECEAYPQAIQWFADGRLAIEGRRVRLRLG